MEQRGTILINPNLLSGFYNSDCRYLPEFEQARHIFEELGLANNPIRIAHATGRLGKPLCSRQTRS